MNKVPQCMLDAPSTDARRSLRPLSELPIGMHALVESVGGSEERRRRLLEMGFCNHAAVTAVRRAPMGDPVVFFIRGYYISLRMAEARCVLVLPAESGGAPAPARAGA